MSTSGLQASERQNAKELDSMKESISDIINQLQDIDPARLSFSPFLDLDTQICLAPVSDSPESSVEELHSSSHSVSGSQRSLEPPPAAHQPRGSAPCHQRPPEEPRGNVTEEGEPDRATSTPVAAAAAATRTPDAAAAPATANRLGAPPPAARPDIPNGTDTPRWSPESTNLESTLDEGRPLIGPPPESVELTVWGSEARPETREAAAAAAAGGGGGGGRRCCCKCCQSGRVPAFLSSLAALLCAAGLLYALYFYVPVKPPDCPDASGRVVFALCCCVVASAPVLLAMLLGAACQFCSGSLSLQEPFPRRRAAQQLFVAASLEQLLLYVLNLAVMAALLPQEQLKLVPILVAIFVLGRLIYWLSVHVCSSWRGFGAGLSLFPLLAMVSLNLFLMYHRNLKEPLLGSQDVLYNQEPSPSSSSWSEETSQRPGGTADILDAQ